MPVRPPSRTGTTFHTNLTVSSTHSIPSRCPNIEASVSAIEHPTTNIRAVRAPHSLSAEGAP